MTTNDIELTKQRQAHQAKYGIEKGFPVWVCFKVDYNQDIKELKVFFTPQAKDKYISTLEHGYNFVAKLVYVQDIKTVQYEA